MGFSHAVTAPGSSVAERLLLGIDVPETVHPSEPVECYGPAASTYTTEELEGKGVRLEFDVERLDRYKRTLAYVWTDGKLFNRILVERRYAQVSTYPPNVRYVDQFVAAQRRARPNDRGLWGGCDDEPTSGGGKGESNSTGGSGGGSGGDNGSSSGGAGGGGDCTPGYDPCLPPASDYDCSGGSGDGPKYAGPVRVTGSDPYDLDSDSDGYGCES
jgi:micrococcal nuclease